MYTHTHMLSSFFLIRIFIIGKNNNIAYAFFLKKSCVMNNAKSIRESIKINTRKEKVGASLWVDFLRKKNNIELMFVSYMNKVIIVSV